MEQNVFICMMPKPYSSMKYKKFHGINAQKLSCVDKKLKIKKKIKKYEKWKPNEKLSINVNTLVRNHIRSFLLVR